MLKEYLDEGIYSAIISSFNFFDITEIRLRANEKVIVVVKTKKYHLKDKLGHFVYASKQIIEEFIKKASKNSLYAYNESIKRGYITLPKGIRVGLAGEVVEENGQVVTIKNFSSINIRIPHLVRNCSLKVFDYIYDGNVHNTLIISPPGAGKTTFIRDLIMQFSSREIPKNILVVDERNEICSSQNGEMEIELSEFCDVITNSSKKYAFSCGIRSLSPDIIVTDEIDLSNDMDSIIESINCGVNVIATIHADNMEQLKKKKGFLEIIENKYFSRFIILSKSEGPGTIEYVYNEKLTPIYIRS
ncbi:MAG: ATPase, T2SS/T4P/T4SS family [Candidatus Onthoplasma sp.]